MSNTPVPTVISLSGWDTDPTKLAIPARVFGELVQIAMGTVTHYHSDLYHDAMWLTQNITDASNLTFTYIVRPYGTWLTNDPNWSAATIESALAEPNSRIFSCAITCHTADRNSPGMWYLLLSEMERP